jgi:hypothetical protein
MSTVSATGLLALAITVLALFVLMRLLMYCFYVIRTPKRERRMESLQEINEREVSEALYPRGRRWP